MTVARSDPPGATLPPVTSQLNSDPNKGTPPDSRDKEKDAVTWKRESKKNERKGYLECTHEFVHLCVLLTGEGLKISKCFCKLWPTATEPNCSTGSPCSFSSLLVGFLS